MKRFCNHHAWQNRNWKVKKVNIAANLLIDNNLSSDNYNTTDSDEER